MNANLNTAHSYIPTCVKPSTLGLDISWEEDLSQVQLSDGLSLIKMLTHSVPTLTAVDLADLLNQLKKPTRSDIALISYHDGHVARHVYRCGANAFAPLSDNAEATRLRIRRHAVSPPILTVYAHRENR